MLSGLVAKNVWSASQGFTYACHISNPKQQAEAISRLAPHLPEPLLYEALGIIQRNSQPSSQTEALIALLPYLPERPKEEVSQRSLKQILFLKNEYMRARGIMTLAAHLPLSLLQEARQKARLLKDPFSRSQALTEIALRLPDEWQGKVLHEALESAEEIDDSLEAIEVLQDWLHTYQNHYCGGPSEQPWQSRCMKLIWWKSWKDGLLTYQKRSSTKP